eukprot:3446908-Pleurochrysis_carterae.AAC.1
MGLSPSPTLQLQPDRPNTLLHMDMKLHHAQRHSNIHTRRSRGVTRLNLNKASNQVVLVGTRSAVEAAKLYIETHLQFLSEVEGEQRETERLRHELRGISIGDNEAGGRERARGGQRGGERGTERVTERGGGRGARDVAPTANGRAGHGRDGVPTTGATAAE